jgi:pyridinium-3,5-bisthiocarboxylic acid mononucleotide nickel chelatase
MPERHIHLDAVGGVAGDMVVAALVDAFPALRARVLADVAAALPAAADLPDFREGSSGGIRALSFGLRHGGGHDHEDDHDDDHDHDHDPLPPRQPAGDPNGHHGAGAGSFRDMVDRIRAAKELEPGTADHAVAILTSLAEVEAAIHRVAVDAVQFHEIADWDSLMDVVAAGSLAAALEPATWSVSELPRGAGLVRTRHGFLPVPTPATASLLVGFRWRDDGIGGERVTPTGAAVLRHLVGRESAGRRPAAGRLSAVGTGAGTRNLPGMPNVLRALVFEAEGSANQDSVAVLSFDIDDMTGEEIGVAAQRLRALPGVLDLSVGMRLGKKGRFTSDVRLLVTPEARENVAAACLSETSTIGLRWRVEQRVVLPRTAVSGATGFRAKQVTRPGGEVTVKAESDDVSGESLAARRAAKARAEAAAAAAPSPGEPRHGR